MNERPLIELIDVSKSYADNKNAVDHLSLAIAKNEVFGLLGPNGAGKTTTISLLCGLIKASSGEINVAGKNLTDHLMELKQIIGIVPQDIALYDTLTARENLEFYGTMYGVPKDELIVRIDRWLQRLDMVENADKRVSTFSGGMKRRINLIAGILHKPEVLFLDEPTVGVDVQSRTMIMEQLKTLNLEGMTIIYTSHHMEEAEKFCTDVAIINRGNIIARGKPAELINAQDDCSDLEGVFLKLTNRE
jgi:ABC-2 type transport system ATP-binding protein